jgi:Luciferase-like monooxygenase
MIELGYHLSSEEHPAPDLVGYARRAEEVGFSYAVISDHFHPWTHRQGQSPFVWSVLGAIAQATERLSLGTVTAPIRRTPPHLVAHASATGGDVAAGPVLPRGRQRREPFVAAKTCVIAGQSGGLSIRGSQVRILPGALQPLQIGVLAAAGRAGTPPCTSRRGVLIRNPGVLVPI